MSHAVTLELSAEAYAALTSEAEARRTTPARLAAAAVEQRYGGPPTPAEHSTARARFEQQFGSLDLRHPSGADNEAIDADLARQYGGMG